MTYRRSSSGSRRSKGGSSAARSSFFALLGVVGAVAFIVLASSLGPDQPAGTPGIPTLPAGFGSFAAISTGTDEAPAPSAGSGPILAGLPIVPVTSFRAGWDSTGATEVAAVLAGTSRRYSALEILSDGNAATLAALGAGPQPAGPHLVLASGPAALRADLTAHPKRLGFLPLADVDPSIRALAWDDAALFGVRRLATLEGWPLLVAPESGAGAAVAGSYDPATAWTLVAGGDINLDGQVAYHVKQLGLGVDFPFDGGTATITGHTCCSFAGLPLPKAKRTGNAGAVRDLLSLSDLSIANFENPAPNNFTYHPAGFKFSADPALIEGLANAGIDWVSLANNHIGNYGDNGILDTLANLDRWGIAHGGADENSEAAHEPSFLDAGGISVAILAYDTIKPAYAATATSPGSSEMTVAGVTADVRAARAGGANLVIVFPHWGTEYTAATTATQRRLAHAAIDAGADLVIGSHTHWAGGVEVYRGKPIFYSLGDFVFSIPRSEQTEEGILLELTFNGPTLVQVRLDPYLILDGSQPNLLDPNGSGSVVLRQVFGASTRLPW